MGNAQSRLYQKLWHVLPSWDTPSSSSWFDKSCKPFANREDKDQFIYATMTVLSQNGSIDLNNIEVRLLYSRRENDRMVARIVAEREGIVKAQIAPRDDGKDQAEAFRALKRHVEMSLDRILQEVPGAMPGGKSEAGVGPSRGSVAVSAQTPTSPARREAPGRMVESRGSQERSAPTVPLDAPPAYGKAVKEWESTDDRKRG